MLLAVLCQDCADCVFSGGVCLVQSTGGNHRVSAVAHGLIPLVTLAMGIDGGANHKRHEERQHHAPNTKPKFLITVHFSSPQFKGISQLKMLPTTMQPTSPTPKAKINSKKSFIVFLPVNAFGYQLLLD